MEKLYSSHRIIIGIDDLLMLGRDVLDDKGNVVVTAEEDLLTTPRSVFSLSGDDVGILKRINIREIFIFFPIQSRT